MEVRTTLGQAFRIGQHHMKKPVKIYLRDKDETWLTVYIITP